MARTTVLTERERKEIMRRHERGQDKASIAERLRLHPRTVDEFVRASTTAIAPIKRRLGVPKHEGGILDRVAARAARLPKEVQREIWRGLVGKSQREGIRIVQDAEREAGGGPNPGRRPRRFLLAKHAAGRCWDLEQRLAELSTTRPVRKEMGVYRAMLAYLQDEMELDQMPGLKLPPKRGAS